jgi:hypothetical protein
LLQSWPDEIYERAAARIGRACYGLLFEETRWVHRRVEKFNVLSHELFHLSLSVDLTIPEQFRRPLEIDQHQWLIPLATLPKRTLRNFDLRDEAGRSVPLVEKKFNALVAEHVLRTAEWVARGSGGPEDISPLVAGYFARVSSGSIDEADMAARQLAEAKEAGDESARAFLEDVSSVRLLKDLTQRYLLLAVVDDVQRRRLFKYSYEFPLTRLQFSMGSRLGWESLPIQAEVPVAARTASYHAEIVVPEELRIDGSFIFDAEQSGVVYAVEGETDRALLYASEIPRDARPFLVFAVRLERPGFPFVAAAIAWATALILIVGARFGDLSPSASPGAPLSLLLAGSALFAGAVARSGEHRLVRVLFFGPRIVLVLNALAGLVAGAVLALGFCNQVVSTTWNAAAVIAVLGACILSITFYRSAPAWGR